jgi:hypothetical protein
MRVLRAALRTLSGSAVLAGPAPATSKCPIDLADAQLDQVTGGGAVTGVAMNNPQGSLMPNLGRPVNAGGGDS